MIKVIAIFLFFALTSCLKIPSVIDLTTEGSNSNDQDFEVVKIASNQQRIRELKWNKDSNTLNYIVEDAHYAFDVISQISRINLPVPESTSKCSSFYWYHIDTIECENLEFYNLPSNASQINISHKNNVAFYFTYIPDLKAPTPIPTIDGYANDTSTGPLNDFYKVWIAKEDGSTKHIGTIKACSYRFEWNSNETYLLINYEGIRYCDEATVWIGDIEQQSIKPINLPEPYTNANAIEWSPYGNQILLSGEQSQINSKIIARFIFNITDGSFEPFQPEMRGGVEAWLASNYFLIRRYNDETSNQYFGLYDYESGQEVPITLSNIKEPYCVYNNSIAISPNRTMIAFIGQVDCQDLHTNISKTEDLWLLDLSNEINLGTP